MFGYLVPLKSELDKAQMEAYRARYCGLCRTIGHRYGRLMRTALSYEMTFLALLLDSLDGTEAPVLPRCGKHPFRSDKWQGNEHLDYCADLTVLLLRAKLLDDRADGTASRLFPMERRLTVMADRASGERPRQAALIRDSLLALAEIEKRGELCPDLPAGCFGALVGNLMRGENEKWSEQLYVFGFALGKLLYLMDAVEDLKSDLKHERYNPLVCLSPESRVGMLNLLADDLLGAFSALPESDLTPILKSILEKGIWCRFRGPKVRQEVNK